jgi:hypothetical protein
MRPRPAAGRRAWLRLVVLDRAHLDSVRRMREDWRHGISLEPSAPPWAAGSGVALRWDDDQPSAPAP